MHTRFLAMRIIAGVLVLAVVLQDVAFAQPASAWPSLLKSFETQPSSSSSLNAPNVIQKSALHYGDELIINVQDAHAQLGAQYAISDLLENLRSSYDLGMISLEGASGVVDTSILSSFPNAEVRTEAAEYFLKSGRMSAGEFHSIVSGGNIQLYGAEDQELYDKNLETFRELHGAVPEAKKAWDSIVLTLDALRQKLYGKTLFQLLDSRRAHGKVEGDFGEHWKLCERLARENGVDDEDYPQMRLYREAMQLEKQVDFSAAAHEREALIRFLEKKIEPARFAALMKNAVQFRGKRMSSGEFHEKLVEEAGRAGIPDAPFQNLIAYVRYLAAFAKVNLMGLVIESKNLEEELAARIAVSEEEKELMRLEERMVRIGHLLNAEFSSQEYETYLSDAAGRDMRLLAGQLETLASRHGLSFHSVDIEPVVRALLPAEKFYALAKERNEALLSNTLARMRKEGVRVAALVTGGFHSEGIAELMEGRKLSHLIVMPQFDGETGERPYVSILTRKPELYGRSADENRSGISVPAFFSNNGDLAKSQTEAVVATLAANRVVTGNSLGEEKVLEWVDEYGRTKGHSSGNGVFSPQELRSVVGEHSVHKEEGAYQVELGGGRGNFEVREDDGNITGIAEAPPADVIKRKSNGAGINDHLVRSAVERVWKKIESVDIEHFRGIEDVKRVFRRDDRFAIMTDDEKEAVLTSLVARLDLSRSSAPVAPWYRPRWTDETQRLLAEDQRPVQEELLNQAEEWTGKAGTKVESLPAADVGSFDESIPDFNPGILSSRWIPEIIAATITFMSVSVSGRWMPIAMTFFFYSFGVRALTLLAVELHERGHRWISFVTDWKLPAIEYADGVERSALVSLLPFTMTPLGMKYVEAGNPGIFRTRIKALGGIAVNAALAWLMFRLSGTFPDAGDFGEAEQYAETFRQMFAWTNVAVAAVSFSDIAAFVTGSAAYFFCGNIAVIARLRSARDTKTLRSVSSASPSGAMSYVQGGVGIVRKLFSGFWIHVAALTGLSWQLVPPGLAKTFQTMAEFTIVRGGQSAGIVIWVKDSLGRTVPIITKILNQKRHILTDDLMAAFRRAQYLAHLNGAHPMDDVVILHGHERYATGGPSKQEEAHPFVWMPGWLTTLFSYNKGSVTPTTGLKIQGSWSSTRNFSTHAASANGDYDTHHFTFLNDKGVPVHYEISSMLVGVIMEKITGVKSDLLGDSPKIAAMMDLLIAKGDWEASVRLGYFYGILDSPGEIFGGELPEAPLVLADTVEERVRILRKWKDGLPNHFPKSDKIQNLASVFEKAFLQHKDSFYEIRNGKSYLVQANVNAFEQMMIENLSSNYLVNGRHPAKIELFVKTAVRAFLRNDMHYAVKQFLKDARGTFGVTVSSSTDTKHIVVASKGQPMSVGYDPANELMAAGSEPAAVVGAMESPTLQNQKYFMDLNLLKGEVAYVGPESLAVYSFEENRQYTQNEIDQRMVPIAGNNYLSSLKPEKSKTLVADDLNDVPKVMAQLRKDFANPESFNARSAEYLFDLLNRKAGSFEESKDLDLVIYGIETSLWVGEEFRQALKKMFPKLKVQSISANKILLGEAESLGIGPETIVLGISQSGQTFAPLQSADIFEKKKKAGQLLEQFILTGEVYSPMGWAALGQSYQPDAEFTNRIFINNAGRRSAETAALVPPSMHATLTELMLYLGRRFQEEHPGQRPYGMWMRPRELELMEKRRDEAIRNSSYIIGMDEKSVQTFAPVRKEIKDVAKIWTRHFTENRRAWVVMALYVFGTVWWFQALPVTQFMTWALGLFGLGNVFLSGYVDLENVWRFTDAAVYVGSAWSAARAMRLMEGRTFKARMGKRTLLIGDVPWVHQLMENFVSKLWSLSYGHDALEVHGGNPQDHFLHRFGHRVARGTLILMGVPDGRLSPEMRQRADAVVMTARQVMGVTNYGVGPEVIAISHDPEIRKKGFYRTIALPSDGVYALPENHLYANDFASLMESRFYSYERVLAMKALSVLSGNDVSNIPIFGWDNSQSQSRTRVATTAGPVSAITPAEIEETAAVGARLANGIVHVDEDFPVFGDEEILNGSSVVHSSTVNPRALTTLMRQAERARTRLAVLSEQYWEEIKKYDERLAGLQVLFKWTSAKVWETAREKRAELDKAIAVAVSAQKKVEDLIASSPRAASDDSFRLRSEVQETFLNAYRTAFATSATPSFNEAVKRFKAAVIALRDDAPSVDPRWSEVYIAGMNLKMKMWTAGVEVNAAKNEALNAETMESFLESKSRFENSINRLKLYGETLLSLDVTLQALKDKETRLKEHGVLERLNALKQEALSATDLETFLEFQSEFETAAADAEAQGFRLDMSSALQALDQKRIELKEEHVIREFGVLTTTLLETRLVDSILTRLLGRYAKILPQIFSISKTRTVMPLLADKIGQVMQIKLPDSESAQKVAALKHQILDEIRKAHQSPDARTDTSSAVAPLKIGVVVSGEFAQDNGDGDQVPEKARLLQLLESRLGKSMKDRFETVFSILPNNASIEERNLEVEKLYRKVGVIVDETVFTGNTANMNLLSVLAKTDERAFRVLSELVQVLASPLVTAEDSMVRSEVVRRIIAGLPAPQPERLEFSVEKLKQWNPERIAQELDDAFVRVSETAQSIKGSPQVSEALQRAADSAEFYLNALPFGTEERAEALVKAMENAQGLRYRLADPSYAEQSHIPSGRIQETLTIVTDLSVAAKDAKGLAYRLRLESLERKLPKAYRQVLLVRDQNIRTLDDLRAAYPEVASAYGDKVIFAATNVTGPQDVISGSTLLSGTTGFVMPDGVFESAPEDGILVSLDAKAATTIGVLEWAARLLVDVNASSKDIEEISFGKIYRYLPPIAPVEYLKLIGQAQDVLESTLAAA